MTILCLVLEANRPWTTNSTESSKWPSIWTPGVSTCWTPPPTSAGTLFPPGSTRGFPQAKIIHPWDLLPPRTDGCAPYLARFSRDMGDANLDVRCNYGERLAGEAQWSPTSREKRARYGATRHSRADQVHPGLTSWVILSRPLRQAQGSPSGTGLGGMYTRTDVLGYSQPSLRDCFRYTLTADCFQRVLYKSAKLKPAKAKIELRSRTHPARLR